MTDQLLVPITVGAIKAPNRVFMAPLTRNRARKDGVPGPLSAEYYTQRASAGLIVTEATQVSQQGQGYASTPGIFTEEQVDGWRKVTAAVHGVGGRIVLQLWHVGRISHPDLQPEGDLPVAPSAIRPEGTTVTYEGSKAFVTPRALETHEIEAIVEQYRVGAANAQRAGFDGNRGPRREWLSDRPVPARREQPARGRLWRQCGESQSLPPQGGRCGNGCLGCGPRRACASRRWAPSTT